MTALRALAASSLLLAMFGCGGGMPPIGPVGTQASIKSQANDEAPNVPHAASYDPVARGDVKIFDAMGTPLGTIDFDGEVRDADKIPLGHIAADGTVRSVSQVMLGTVRSDGTVLDPKSDPLGHVMDDGAIDTPQFSKVGEIEEDGTLRNSGSVNVGRFQGYKPELRDEVAAYVFFFAKGSMRVLN